jgi:hypothetical protein
MKTDSIHKLADSLGISWDGDKTFMKWCNQLVGKKHLDDMTSDELLKVYTHIRNGWYSKEIIESIFVLETMRKELISEYERK